jgi:diguanylate cyclase (GGDEF)-like protein/PAS domain S-box-containing protein
MAKFIESEKDGNSIFYADPRHFDLNISKIICSSVNLLNDAILITEAEPLKREGPRIVWANHAFYRATGYKESEVIGRTPRILQGPLSDRGALDRISAALFKWQPIREEVLNYRKDGTTFWNELEIVPIANEKGWFTHWISVQRDCTLRKNFQKQQTESSKALQLIADNVPGLVFQIRFTLDGEWCFTFVSRVVEEFLNISPQMLYDDATVVLRTIHMDDLEKMKTSVLESSKTMTPWIHEFRTIQPNSSVHWLMGKATPITDSDGSILWNGFIADITERHILEDAVRNFAFHDTLTGLANRRLLGDRIQQAISHVKRTNCSGALILLDLDKFKVLNDMYGHAAGDGVLIAVAERLKNSVIEVDTVARLGGDEFVVLLTNVNENRTQDFAALEVLAEKIRLSLESPHHLCIPDGAGSRSMKFSCEASIGVVVFNDVQVNEGEILKRADIAMYAAKSAGGNQVRFFEKK